MTSKSWSSAVPRESAHRYTLSTHHLSSVYLSDKRSALPLTAAYGQESNNSDLVRVCDMEALLKADIPSIWAAL
jgi:hypothetical protein